MTDSRFRPAHRALLAMCAAFAPLFAGAAEEPVNPNSFSTPGYPAGLQRGIIGPIGPTGPQANPPSAQGSRPNAAPSGNGSNPRQGAASDSNPAEPSARRADRPPPKPIDPGHGCSCSSFTWSEMKTSSMLG